MVRLADLPATKREGMERYKTPCFGTQPWVNGISLKQATVTLISTAGLIMRGDRPVTPHDPRYRTIAHSGAANDILMSHVSVNFDRTGFQQDLNVVLPRERLQELADAGEIGAVADEHYAFMGATQAHLLEKSSRKLAALLHKKGIDTALLLPV
jgi:D-proline reductase (dithiol) PrdB